MKIKDTFDFDFERLDKSYVKDLQDAYDRLEYLLKNASMYDNSEDNIVPIWEYVTKEKNDTLFYALTCLIVSTDETTDFASITDRIMYDDEVEDYEELDY